MFDYSKYSRRGGGLNTAQAVAENSQPDIMSTVDTIKSGAENTEDLKPENLEGAKFSIITWALLFLGYLLWSWIDSQETVQDSVKPENVKLNIRNLLIITIGSIIGINILNVGFTKLTKMNVPILSKVSGSILPLVRL